jgi:hypothetical protein
MAGIPENVGDESAVYSGIGKRRLNSVAANQG